MFAVTENLPLAGKGVKRKEEMEGDDGGRARERDN